MKTYNLKLVRKLPYITKHIHLLVYNSLVRLYIEYGIVTWGGVKNSKQQKIRSLQKKAIRAVNNSTFKAHSNPLFSKLKVLNLDDTYKQT